MPANYRRYPALLGAAAIFAALPLPAPAELPRAPIVIENASGACVPSVEICGDGVDEDCNGADAACPGTDSDRDGYARGADCDDTDHFVYPGVSIPCSAGCGQGTKTCLTTGAYSDCSCTPLCEAKSGGRCFYISKLTGSDSSPGTFAQPWKTLRMVSRADSPPPGAAVLAAGDVVYLMSGVYDETVTYGNYRMVLLLFSQNGTASAPIVVRRYPGARPVIAPAVRSEGIVAENSSNIVLDGLEVTKAYQNGIKISSGRGIELHRLWVHGIDGVDNDNVAGIQILACEDVDIHHSVINDNYDRTNADTGGRPTENSRNIVIFSGAAVRVRFSTIFQTPPVTAPKTGACLGYKHPSEASGALFEVSGSTFRNCFDAAIQSYTKGGRFNHNLILNSRRAFRIWTSGGYTDLTDYVIEKNTFIETQVLDYRPSGTAEAGGNYGPLVYRSNIAVFSGPYGGDEGGIHNVDPYGPDVYYNRLVQPGQFVLGGNCYYNPAGGQVMFNFYMANDAPERVKGGTLNLAQWQALGFDASSHVTNPQLDSSFLPADSRCQQAGLYAQ